MKKAIDSIPSDKVSCAVAVEHEGLLHRRHGRNEQMDRQRPNEGDRDEHDEEIRRGRKGIVMLEVSTGSHSEVLRELSAIQLRTKVLLLNLSYYEV